MPAYFQEFPPMENPTYIPDYMVKNYHLICYLNTFVHGFLWDSDTIHTFIVSFLRSSVQCNKYEKIYIFLWLFCVLFRFIDFHYLIIQYKYLA